MTRIGIVVSRYNEVVVQGLLAGARRALTEAGLSGSDVRVLEVPGAFEIPWGVVHLIETWAPDGVVALGAILQGETDHHAYLAQAVFHALAQVSIQHKIPVGLGILTASDLSQALERAGGKRGNKGYEAARAVLLCLQGVRVPP